MTCPLNIPARKILSDTNNIYCGDTNNIYCGDTNNIYCGDTIINTEKDISFNDIINIDWNITVNSNQIWIIVVIYKDDIDLHIVGISLNERLSKM